MKTFLKWGIMFLVLILFFNGSALAEKPADTSAQIQTENSRECIDLSRIERLEVINDQIILFHMKNNKIYKNTLPYSCPMLGLGKGIIHRTSVNRICKADIFRVLIYDSTCSFGMFEPYFEDVQSDDDLGKGGSR